MALPDPAVGLFVRDTEIGAPRPGTQLGVCERGWRLVVEGSVVDTTVAWFGELMTGTFDVVLPDAFAVLGRDEVQRLFY